MTVEPKVVGVREPVTLRFTYTAGEEGIAEGGGVMCFVSRFWYWAPPQARSSSRPGYFTAVCSNPGVILAIDDRLPNNLIAIRVESGRLDPGDEIVLTYGDTSGGRFEGGRGLSDRFAEHRERFFFRVDGDGDQFATPIAEQPTFDVVATEGVQIHCVGPSRASEGEEVELGISVLDAALNRVETFEGEVILRALDNPSWPERRVQLGPEHRGARRVSLALDQAGVWLLEASDLAGSLRRGVSNPILVAPAAEERYRLFFGDLQIHGNLSDGTGTPEDLYTYARDVARLDVAAVTEHDAWGYEPLKGPSGGWEQSKSVTEELYEPGRFVTFPAYEYTNWTTGHRHVLFLHPGEADVFSWRDEETKTPEGLWERLKGRQAITIPHHPGGGPIPIFWPVHDSGFEPVVEIASIHGVSERMDHPAVIHQPVASGMVVEALRRGYRLGFLGSGDTHDGHPGMGNPAQPPPGLAGIWAEELTRQSIFEAIRARRVYATFGSRSVLRFHCGGVPMGGELDAGQPREFEALVLADAPIRKIEMVKNGEPIEAFESDGLFAAVTWKDDAEGKSGDSVYVRVALESGGWIWSSPIWVK